jgi:hypothetical protein
MRAIPLLLACTLLACAKASQTPPSRPGASPPPRASTSNGGNGNAAPPSFVRTTAETPATRLIDVRDGLTRPAAMRALIDALSQRYTVDVSDSRAGFAMTTWQASVVRDGVPDLRYRTRFVARYTGDDWRSLRLQSEARWSRGEEADVGYDLTQLAALAADLNVRLGRTP